MRLTAWCRYCDSQLAEAGPRRLICPADGQEYVLCDLEPPAGCAVCGFRHFHVRKDFPRRLGLAVVLVAGGLCFTPLVPPQLFFLPLIVASAIDLGLYQFLPWKTVCYVCDAEYRGAAPDPSLEPYDLEQATECKRLRWPKPAES